MSTTVRELVTKWGLDIDDAPLKNMERGIAGLKRNFLLLAGAGSALAGTLFGIAKSTSNYGDNVAKTADRLGVNIALLQEYRFAAQRAGVAQEEFDKSLQMFLRNAQDAIDGTGEAKDAFKKLGIQLKDSAGNMRPAESLMGEIADAMNRLPTQAERVQVAFDIFGRGGVRMLNLFKEGSRGINELRLEAQALGGVMGEEAARDAEKFNDALDDLKFAFIGIKNFVGSQLIPVLTDAAHEILEWVKANREFLRLRLKQVFEELLKATKQFFNIVRYGFTLLGRLIDIFGGVENSIKLAVLAMGAFLAVSSASALGSIVLGLSALISAFGKVGSAALLANLKIMLIPLAVGAAIVALGLIVEDVIAFFQGRDSVTKHVVDFFRIMSDEMEAWFVGAHNTIVRFTNLIRKIPVIGGMFGDAAPLIEVGMNRGRHFTPDASAGGAASVTTNASINVNVAGLPPDQAKDVISGAMDDTMSRTLRETQRAFFGGTER